MPISYVNYSRVNKNWYEAVFVKMPHSVKISIGRGEEIAEVLIWCEDNFGPMLTDVGMVDPRLAKERWTYTPHIAHARTFWFKRHKDAMHFALRWQ